MAASAVSQSAFSLLRERSETVSFAESLTGGLLAAELIGNAGSSEVIGESYVTYAESAKVRLLGVQQETLDTDGVVSAACAAQMAAGVRARSGASWGVSTTGVAGPGGGSESTPVGTVFVGVAGRNGVQTWEHHLQGDRMQVRMQAVEAALKALIACMEQQEQKK